MVDYSRFDHIGSDSDSGGDDVPVAANNVPKPSNANASRPSPPASARAGSSPPQRGAGPQASGPAGGGGGGDGGGGGAGGAGGGEGAEGTGLLPQPMMMPASKKGKEGRIKFEHEGEGKKP